MCMDSESISCTFKLSASQTCTFCGLARTETYPLTKWKCSSCSKHPYRLYSNSLFQKVWPKDCSCYFKGVHVRTFIREVYVFIYLMFAKSASWDFLFNQLPQLWNGLPPIDCSLRFQFDLHLLNHSFGHTFYITLTCHIEFGPGPELVHMDQIGYLY